MNQDKISVIMPAYNVESYIAESIESVLKQTYSNFELIIVNDGSVDKTREIVLSYASRDARVILCDEENGGVAVARNTGLEKAVGAYISFLDADDLWEPEFLSKVYQKMIAGSKDQGFVYARTKEVFLDGKEAVVGPADCVSGKLEKFIHYTNELRLRFHISAVLVQRSLIEQYGLRFESGIKISEDTGFFIELLSITEAAYVDEVLSIYRRRESSATTGVWVPGDWVDAVIVYEKITAFVEKYYPEVMPAFKRMRNYQTYRFVLKCLRHGFINDAAMYIERWRAWLRDFSVGDGKINDRFKCRLLLSSDSTRLKWIAILRL